MEQMNILEIIVMAVCILSAMYVGWLLTETKHRIAEKHPLLNRKPFSCRPCLTFHLSWMLSGAMSFCFSNLTFFAIGVILSFVVWFILEINNRKKIDK